MTRPIVICAVLLSLVLPASVVRAHEVRPAYLQITQSDAEHYRIVWKQPTMGELAVRLAPRLSNGWLEGQPADQYAAAGFLIRTWNIASTQSLAGSTLSIEGLQHTITDVLVRVRLLDGPNVETILRPEQPHFVISANSHEAVAVPVFLVRGIEHILAGVDHLLFVLGLLLIVRDRWMLLKAVSAFTVAHSITLAAAMLAKVSLPPQLVESLIALSILFLGSEVLRAQRGGTSLTLRYPWAVAFFFGLFHGMGFAGGLAELGFAAGDLLAALLFFNVGVEIGQLAFIAVVLLAGRGLSALKLGPPVLLTRIPAHVVGIAGAYWTFQTSTALLGVV